MNENNLKNIRIGFMVSAVSFIFFLILVEIGLRVGGHFYLQKVLSSSQSQADKGTDHVILTLGDSYTLTVAGDAENWWQESYPHQLRDRLASERPGQYSVVNAGRCEANSAEAYEYLSKAVRVQKINSVVLLIGAANTFNHVGFNKEISFFSHLKILRLVRIFNINLKGWVLEKKVSRQIKKIDAKIFEYASEESAMQKNIRLIDEQIKSNKHVAAAELIRQAVREGNVQLEDGYKADIYTRMALTYFKVADYENAMEMFFKIIERYPSDFSNYYFLFEAYQFQSKFDVNDMARFFDRIKAANPELTKNILFKTYTSLLKTMGEKEQEISDWLHRDLKKIVGLARTEGIDLIIQNYPYPYRMANRVLEQTAKEYQLPFINQLDVFNSLPPEDEDVYFSDHYHLTAEGHRLMMESLYAIYESKG